MARALTALQQRLLDTIVEAQLAQPSHHNRVTGKRLRALVLPESGRKLSRRELRAELEPIMPTLVEDIGYDSDRDNYFVTHEGVLTSKYAETAFRVLGCALEVFKSKFAEDPDFSSYSWEEFKQREPSLTDSEFPLALLLISTARLSGSARTSPSPPAFEMAPASDVEDLVDLPDVKALREYLLGRLRKPNPEYELSLSEHEGVRRVFISHDSSEVELALFLSKLIEARAPKNLKVFVAKRDIGAGQAPYIVMLEEWLKQSDALLALCTPRSRNSSWLWWECGTVWAQQKLILPLFVDTTASQFGGPIIHLSQGRSFDDAVQLSEALETLFLHLSPEVEFTPLTEGERLEHRAVCAEAQLRNRK